MNEMRPSFLIICTDQMRADHMRCAGKEAREDCSVLGCLPISGANQWTPRRAK